MSAAATATYSPVGASCDKRRETREELRRHLAEDADWPRADGRSFQDCRPASDGSPGFHACFYTLQGRPQFCFIYANRTNNCCIGSCYAEFGKTKFIVSVCIKAHSSYVVSGHIAAMEKGRVGERYLLTGENKSFMQIFDLAANITNTKAPSF